MFHKLTQQKVGCTSVMIDLPAKDYLDLVGEVYEKYQGGIQGQRAALRTKTAKIIRTRMVSDISRGVSLPPLVLGILLSNDDYNQNLAKIESRTDFLLFLTKIEKTGISIIDGMQRTTAIIEAMNEASEDKISDVRVEFWIAERANSLIYRMLVLNTGQVPWDIARQLEAIYRPLLNKIYESAGEDLRLIAKDADRRLKLGSDGFATEDVAELLLIFSARKREINIKDQIAQDFVRLDLIESTSHIDFINYFSEGLILLSKLNEAISTVDVKVEAGALKKYDQGRELLLRGFPPKVGFFVALSIYLFDKPGFDTDWAKVEDKFDKVKIHMLRIIKEINDAKTQEEKESILLLEDLEERISKHRVGTTQVGRFQREFFEKAFSAFFADIDRIKNFQALWNAY